MAPFDGAARHDPDSKKKTVTSLKLEFSKAADYPRIDAMFDPVIKQDYDPQGFVIKRFEPAFRKAVNEGCAVFLSDQQGNVQTMTIAYRVKDHKVPGPGAAPDYTELGTTLARIHGYHSANLIVAAVMLREWWDNPPQQMMVAEIRNDNVPSQKTYRDTLGWRRIADRDLSEHIFHVTDQTIADAKDKCVDSATTDRLLQTVSWYECPPQALASHARVLLALMDQGGLLNKKTGDFIPVDFSALEAEGLTRKRLESIAQGETSRDKIRNLSP